MTKGLRLAGAALGVVVLGCVGLGCGGGAGNESDLGGMPVMAGTFVGTTHQKQPLSIGVSDGITFASVTCNNPQFVLIGKFSPPQPIASDGTFEVQVSAGNNAATIDGLFLNQDRIKGTITGDNFCAGKFHASRCEGNEAGCSVPTTTATPTPTFTPPPSLTPTPQPTPTPQQTTVVSPTGPTPVVSPTPFCGNGVVDGDEECDGGDLQDLTCGDCCDDDGGTLKCTSSCTLDFSACTAGGCSADNCL